MRKSKSLRKIRTHKSVQLPSWVVPLRYHLLLTPDATHHSFSGEEAVELRLLKPVQELTLHARDLEIQEAVLSVKKEKIPAERIQYNSDEETVTFSFNKKVSGSCTLNLRFTGPITDKLAGFYRSTYTINGEVKTLATTQFEPVDARRAFPCIDEPERKAIFDITLMIPKDHVAVSNTYELEVREHEGDYKVVKFAPTPKMSTYLVAFIVGNLEYVEGKTKDDVAIRVFVTPGKKKQAEFALGVAIKVLQFYTDYFGIAYPLPLLDLIAVPDFPVGAMENWGAITYRETALLIDPEHSSLAAKQRVTLVIAHELAHQWFGNLVTMKWWTQLWLNESFASWIEFLAMDHVFPEWNMWEQFHVMDKVDGLHLDALASTHPIEVPVAHPKEISEIFDAISYHKGASVIHMLHDYLGYTLFRKGLRRYMQAYKYSNTVTDDLWNALAAASSKDIRKLMDPWIKTPGYPIVRVGRTKKGVELSQERFFSNPKSRIRTPQRWHIPVRIETDRAQATVSILMRKQKERITLKDTSEWIAVNAGQAGFFRVLYEPVLLERLHRPIADKVLPAVDRLSILSDTFAAAKAGLTQTKSVLDLLGAYMEEDNYNVWAQIAGVVGALDHALYNHEMRPRLHEYALTLFTPLSQKMGWEKKSGETHADVLLRSLAIAQAGRYGDEQVVSKARELFFAYAANAGTIDPDIRAAVYSTVALHGGIEEYQLCMNLWRASELQEEKNRLTVALGYFKDPRLAQRTLDLSISPEVRAQDTRIVQAGVLANPAASEVTWEWTKKHWGLLYERFSHTGSLFNFIVLGLFGHFNDESKLKEVTVFFRKNKDKKKGAERALAQALEDVQGRLIWRKKAQKEIVAFLKSR